MNFLIIIGKLDMPEMEINHLHHETYPDAVLFNEKNAMNGARRKRFCG